MPLQAPSPTSLEKGQFAETCPFSTKVEKVAQRAG